MCKVLCAECRGSDNPCRHVNEYGRTTSAQDCQRCDDCQHPGIVNMPVVSISDCSECGQSVDVHECGYCGLLIAIEQERRAA